MSDYCERCGDEVSSRATDDAGVVVGPCCQNLPQPWHRGEDGLYNLTTPLGENWEELDQEIDREEEEEEHPDGFGPDMYLDEAQCNCDRACTRPQTRMHRGERWIDRAYPHRLECAAIIDE